MTLGQKQAQLTAELSEFKNGQDRFAFLVERAKKLSALPVEQRVEKNLLAGCLAKLWFVSSVQNGKCFFVCDSDSLVVKAVAGLLCDFYSGHLSAEIAAHDPQFLAPLGITQHLTPNRRNALAKVWNEIKTFAENQAQ